MRHEVSRELYAYWSALRAGRSAPERNDIEPSAIRGILADTFVLEFDEPLSFPFRIACSRAQALFQTELRGFPFLHIFREADREELKFVLSRMANEAQPHLIRAEARPPGLAALEVEVTLLPLRHAGSACSRVLGSIAIIGSAHWLGLVGAGPATLTSVCLLDPISTTESTSNSAALAQSRYGASRGRSAERFLSFWRRAGSVGPKSGRSKADLRLPR